jgi:hypothetical protein
LFAAMLVIATAYRNFWISRFEGWHVLPSRGYAKRFLGTLGRVAAIEGGRKPQRGPVVPEKSPTWSANRDRLPE